MHFRSIDLAGPVLGEEEQCAVRHVLESGWLTMGERVRAFETAFAAMHRASDALAVNSCTSSLHLALLALGIGKGDEVIVPGVTFVATINAVLYTGAKPVLADIGSISTPIIHPAEADALVGPRTRAVIVVHYGGYTADMDGWRTFCDRRDLFLIADAAHAPGETFAASRTDAACFSFFPNKNMTTAEGGMLLAHDPEVLSRARAMRSHGMTTLTMDRHEGHAFTYDVTMLGYNYRMDELRAAIGLAQLKRLPALNARRRRLSVLYRDLLVQDIPEATPTFSASWPTAAHLMTLLLPPGMDRNRIMADMRASGVQTSIHYPPLHLFSHHRSALGDIRLPKSEEYGRRTLTLPLHPGLSEKDVEYVVSTLREAIDRIYPAFDLPVIENRCRRASKSLHL